jgi:hypothetical protein
MSQLFILALEFHSGVYFKLSANMGIRENVQKLITKKLEENVSLEHQIMSNKAYIQGLQDSMKFLPRDGNGVAEYVLREGSALAKTRDALRAAGTPLAIVDILRALGKPQDKEHRTSLAGTLSGYARDGKVFTKTAPNTFGLLEFRTIPSEDSEIPEDFGSMEKQS